MLNGINQLEILQCIICSRTFNASQRRPMLICQSQHTICKQCFDDLMIQDISKRKCPMCRVDIVSQKVTQFRALIEIRDVASKIRKDGSIIKKTLTQAQKKEQQLLKELSTSKDEIKELKWQLDAINSLHSVYIQQLKAESTKRQQQLNNKIQVLQDAGRQRLQLIQQYSAQLKLWMKSSEQYRLKYEESLVKIEEMQLLNSYFMKQLQNSSIKQTQKKKSQRKSIEEVMEPVKVQAKQIKKQISTKKGSAKPSKKPSKDDQIIDLSNEDLEQINLNECTQLRKLYLSNNKLTHIELGMNTQLQHLNLSKNQLMGIDLSNNQLLSGVDLSENKLSFVLIRFKPKMDVDLSNQNIKNCDIMIDCFSNQEKLCQKFIQEQTEKYRIGGNKWGINCNEYECAYRFQISGENR